MSRTFAFASHSQSVGFDSIDVRATLRAMLAISQNASSTASAQTRLLSVLVETANARRIVLALCTNKRRTRVAVSAEAGDAGVRMLTPPQPLTAYDGAELPPSLASKSASKSGVASTTTASMAALPASLALAPHAVVRYVLRSGQPLHIDDVSSSRHAVLGDPYFRLHRVRSLLAVPIAHRRAPLGVVYLEHGVTPCVFTDDRVDIVSVLAAQFAITMQHAQLLEHARQHHDALLRFVPQQGRERDE